MCGLCGVLGGESHWTDGVDRQGAPQSASEAPWLRRQARQRRVALVSVILRRYGVRVTDWQGTTFLVTGPTGRTELADSLSDLWPKAEAVIGRPIDPLDPEILDALDDDR